MVADLFVLSGISGDLLPGDAGLTLHVLLVLQDHQDNILSLQPAAFTPQDGIVINLDVCRHRHIYAKLTLLFFLINFF